jgi:hypothetical protein
VTLDPQGSELYLDHNLLPTPLRKLHPRTVLRLAKAGKLGDVRPVRFTKHGGVYYSRRAVEAYLRSREAASLETEA